MESYYGIIFMKRIPGMHGTSPEPPGIPGIPGDAPGPLGTPLEPWETSLNPPGEAPGTPGDLQGPSMDDKQS